MKITFVTPTPDLSGGMRVIGKYADSMKKLGHDVVVISTPLPQPTLRQQVKSILKGKGLISVPKRQPSHFDHLDIDCRVKKQFRPIADADVPDADVVVATWWETAEWVAKLSKSKGAKAYFIQHYEVFDYLPKERVKATWSLPIHKIVVSQWLVDIAQNVYGDRDVSYVPNGIDTQQFYAAPRSKQPIPTVGMVYSEPYWKGCDISLKAFSLAAEKIPGLRLIAFGSYPRILHLPLPEGAEYTHNPPQPSIKDLYASCDAWLFGSRMEGFGLPILEAMACRTPVIGTPAGAAPELLGNGGGILVKPEDPEDMARAIVQMCSLSNPEWQAMSDAAYATSKHYSWNKPTEQFEQALHTVIERSQSTPSSAMPQHGSMNLPNLAS